MLSFSAVSTASTGTGYFGTILMILPIIVFSFNHSPMISSFVVKQRATYGIEATDAKCAQIQKSLLHHDIRRSYVLRLE